MLRGDCKVSDIGFWTTITVSGGVDCMMVAPAYANSDCSVSVDAVFSKRACIACSAAAKEALPVSNASSTRTPAMTCNLELLFFILTSAIILECATGGTVNNRHSSRELCVIDVGGALNAGKYVSYQ
jgi:hypothetical protein